MSEWKTYKLAEIIQIIGGGTPKTTITEYWNGYIPWLSVVDFANGQKHVYNTEKTITSKGLRDSSTKLLQKGQIIISARGTVGALAVLGRDMAFNQSCYGIKANGKTDNDFLFYLLRNTIERIKKKTHGAVFDTITRQTFENIEVQIPEGLDEQRQIASILSSLDNKIELNLQMNQTLEAIAQAIFHERFGKYKTGDELPEGWRTGCVLEIADLYSGGTPKTDVKEYWDGEIGWISAKDITKNDQGFITSTEKRITKKGLNNSAARLLPQYTTVLTARGTVGNFSMLPKEMAISQSNYGLKAQDNSNYFLFLLVRSMIDMMKQFSYGTVFDTITTKTFREMEIVLPDQRIIHEIESTITPLFYRKLEIAMEIKSLQQLRDMLLPRLMSGKMDVELTNSI